MARTAATARGNHSDSGAPAGQQDSPPANPPHNDDNEEENDDQDLNDDSEEGFNVDAQLESAKSRLAEARDRFFTYTRAFSYKGEKGEYAIRADCNGSTSTDAMDYGWPRAFVGEEPQPVTAAMWLKNMETQQYLLVAVWSFSPTGDETNVYQLPGYEDDIFSACGYGYNDINKDLITFDDCRDAFSISSGDQKEDDLFCPALESIPVPDMAEFDRRVPNNQRSRDDVCEAHGKDKVCMYCRFNKRARRGEPAESEEEDEEAEEAEVGEGGVENE